MKDLNTTVGKWVKNVQAAGPDYVAGVQRTGDWQQKTSNSSNAYREGLNAAMAAGKWEKGVQNTPNQTWQANTINKSNRWGQGVNAGQAKFANAMNNVLAQEANILPSLPASGAKGSEANIQRSSEFQRRMHAAFAGAAGMASVPAYPTAGTTAYKPMTY